MSGVVEESDDMMCCASCGIAAVDAVKLKKCTACYLVRYCSHKCPFCRHPSLATEEVRFLMNVKRADANDPAAIFQMGVKCLKEGDYDGAFQYWTKAAGLGDVTAHFNLSLMYHNGEVGKDKKKELHHLEQAAIGGHPTARHNLGCIEGGNGRTDRAVKHWIMASKLGEDAALSSLRSFYSKGFVGKEDFASALRGYQAAVDATKSHQREAAKEFYETSGGE
ncbi:hypothetical protein QTG54_002605 [Skeletonema marinoi]|uniref:MYND-type domain-containing protein n=1 Tax=Skeletonema marinoi TaxID=267567 RepID=A0AAD8YIM8_9STRA|nr:hypothetical protein QTG54_002605 [Skeletonema marinoi]